MLLIEYLLLIEYQMDNRWPRFDDELVCDGEWWLPGNDVAQIPGKLRYTPSDGVRLECGRRLIPVSQKFRSPPQTVHGTIHPGGPVTLLDAQSSFTGWDPIGTQLITAFGLIIGAAVESRHSPIAGMSLWLDDLDVWKSDGPFSHGTYNEPSSTIIRYQYDVDLTPEPPQFVDSIGADVSIPASCGTVGGGHQISLSHESHLAFRFRQAITLTTAVGIAYQVELLFTLLTGSTTNVQRIQIHLPPEHAEFQRDIHLLFGRARRRRGRRFYPQQDMPVPYDRIQNLGKLLNSWFATASVFSPVTKLLASSLFHSDPEFLENRFLTLAQAIEGYCRIAYPDDRYLPSDVFKPIREDLKQRLPADIDSNFKKIAENRIAGLNEFTLHDRLKHLFRRHEWLRVLLASNDDPTPDDDTVDRFVRAVRTARNNLTHVEAGRQRNSGIDYAILWRLRAILCALLLRDAGIDIGSRIEEYRGKQNPIGWWMDYAED